MRASYTVNGIAKVADLASDDPVELERFIDTENAKAAAKPAPATPMRNRDVLREHGTRPEPRK